MTIEQSILNQGILEVVHDDMALLSKVDQAAFAMVRRSGLGASDSSVVLGVNQWTSLEDLIEEKKSIGLTDHEIEVGNKENVRKGRDLEPLILENFEKNLGLTVIKPAPMYRIIKHPQLTINFDGVTRYGEAHTPVEAKFVSAFANKYWDRGKQIHNWYEGNPLICGGATIQEHITEEAKLYGIPGYYYTQIQQQMLGLNAEFGYFAVVFDKGWEYAAYKVFKDEWVQRELIKSSADVWARIKGIL
jgi:predicted phage-related endonuclease